MRFEKTFLHSKVGRRIFILFVCCALIPIAVLALLYYGQFTKQLPGFDVRLVVGRVTTGRPKVDRHAAVVANRENVNQLFQIRAMILVVAPSNGQCTPTSAHLFAGGIRVVAMKGDCGGVVV